MLIGDLLYYKPNGLRMRALDSGVTAEYAARASSKDEIAQWRCTNGDPRDIRYFRAGKQITGDEIPEALR